MKTENSPDSFLSNFDMSIERYNLCFSDYVQGIGPWGSPFTFSSYGITYEQMIKKIQQSPDFLNFTISFIIDLEKQSEYEKALCVLKEAGISQEQLQNALNEVPNDRL